MNKHTVVLGMILSPPDNALEWKIKTTPYYKICMERVVKKQSDGYRHFNPRYNLGLEELGVSRKFLTTTVNLQG